MNALIPIRTSDFYNLCLRAFEHARVPLHKSTFSKKMYGNFVHVFLLVLKQRLKVSYKVLEKLASEFGLQRMLCIKRIPHFTTVQKALQRLPKHLFESMVRACHSLLDMKGMLSAIDGTGFSNTNPSHYYLNRIDGVKVRNYTKTVLLADLDSKLVLNMTSTSDYQSETLSFIPLVGELKHALKCVLVDKGYDSRYNREYCDSLGIEHHIPFRVFSQQQNKYGLKVKRSAKRRRAMQTFNADVYKRRVLVESIISAVKRTYGSWVCSRKPENQQKDVVIKVLAYDLDKIGNKIRLTILYIWGGILQRLNMRNL